MAAVHDKTDAALLTLNVNSNEMPDANSKRKPKEDKTSPAKPTKHSDIQLDKFKRRLVRAVARYRQQKTPEDQMWRELKREIGCDCKTLWQHMRALTIKKLKRLLPANDMLANITKVARFTATDWLLFDLILVHENIDVITLNDQQDKSDYTQEEKPECMTELFELVKKHHVEELVGDELTEAWIRVTLDYNSVGRQCSPMLLQLRWYQMKELCRSVFYNFWCSYRGTKRYLPQALAIKPTELQADIVKQYRTIITDQFPKWEKLIEERRVILSEEFALTRKGGKKAEKPPEANNCPLVTIVTDYLLNVTGILAPTYNILTPQTLPAASSEKDIEVIEPHVETIDLASDESEKNYDIPPSSDDKNIEHTIDISKNTISIKAEPHDEDVLELDSLPNVDHRNTTENLVKNSTTEIINLENEIDEENVLLPTITSVVSNADEVGKRDSEDEINEILEEKAKDLRNSIAPDHSHKDSQKHNEQKANNLIKIEITQVKCEYDHTEHNMKIAKENAEDNSTRNDMDISRLKSEPTQCDSDEEINKLIHEKAEKFMSSDVVQIDTKTGDIFPDLCNVSETNVNIVSDGPDFTLKLEIDIEKDNDIIGNDNTEEKLNEAFDEMDFEDDGIEFVDDGIEFVDEQANDKNKDIKTEIESSSDIGDDETNGEESDVPKIDLKLLMDPKVFTKKLDLMEVFKFTDYHNVNDNRVIECALLESKPVDRLAVKEEDIKNFREEALLGYKIDGTQDNDDTDESEDEFADKRVKITSWLLQKPKNRNYNPIQLCKNPDFNTRLKRLTAGFLKLTTNRALLKECKPLTIDLHKAFETKLVSGTIYLKGGDFKSAKIAAPEINNKDLVTPSVIPGQSIINSGTNRSNILNQALPQNIEAIGNSSQSYPKVTCTKSGASERSKVIKLPDIDQVRRVNQGLLTAEVTPIRVDNNITDANINICKQDNKRTKFTPAPVLVGAKETSAIDSGSQVKMESPDIVENLNKSHITSEGLNIPTNDLLTLKKSDQIIDISNQTSASPAGKRKCQGAKGDKKNKKSTMPVYSDKFKRFVSSDTPLSYNAPVCRDAVTWSAKYVSNYYADSLLTIDTLNKILYLINSDTSEKEKSKNSTSNETENENNKDTTTSNETTTEQKAPSVEDNKFASFLGEQHKKRQTFIARQRRRRTQLLPVPYKGIYCCWAREKLSYLNINRPLKGHGCLKFNCKCCCRSQLNKMKIKIFDKKREASKSTVNREDSMTIVLSDDEETRRQKDSETCMNENGEKKSEVVNLDDTSNNAGDSPTDKLSETSSNIPTSVPPPLIGISSKDSSNKVENDPAASTKKGKCKTVVIPAKGHPYCENLQPILPKPLSVKDINKLTQTRRITIPVQPQLTTIAPAFYVTENQNSRASVSVINNTGRNKIENFKNPIFLGVNKVLLCSLPQTTKVLPQLPALPDGVNFMLLPDGTLTLGIASVVELNPHQVCAFPPMMSIIQEELRKNKSVFATPNIENVPLIQENIVETPSNTIAPPSETNIAINNSELTQCNVLQNTANPEEAVEIQNVDNSNENTGNVPINGNSEIANREVGSKETVQEQQTIENSVQVQTQTVESQSTLENQASSSVTTDTTATSPEKYPKNQEESRKTILSDLMEMSGISTEDIGMTVDSCAEPNINDVLPVSETALPTTPALPSNIIPITRVTSTNDKQKIVQSDITITGPYSNLLSFELNNSTNVLLNYIGQIRPELNAVTSFSELKYVCDNNGTFYKLDIETGSIVPINVCLKRKSSVMPTTSMLSGSKEVIDLTDDNDLPTDAPRKDNTSSVGQDDHDISFEFYSQAKEPVVKPLKLFKAVRSTDKIKGRSIIRPNIIRKEKGSNAGTDNVLYMELPSIMGAGEYTVQPSQDDSYDSSDDEPLAKKSKRLKTSNKNDEELLEPVVRETGDKVDAGNEDDMGGNNVDMGGNEGDMGGDIGDISASDMNNMDIEGVNPELHPVVFEEDSDSEDDMCILGV